MNPTSYLFGSQFACAQTAIFSAEPCYKNAGYETSIVLWITACEYRILTSRNPNQIRAALWRIFSSNESVPANRRQDSMQTVVRTSNFFINQLRTLKSFQIFKSEIKKSKTYSG